MCLSHSGLSAHSFSFDGLNVRYIKYRQLLYIQTETLEEVAVLACGFLKIDTLRGYYSPLRFRLVVF